MGHAIVDDLDIADAGLPELIPSGYAAAYVAYLRGAPLVIIPVLGELLLREKPGFTIYETRNFVSSQRIFLW